MKRYRNTIWTMLTTVFSATAVLAEGLPSGYVACEYVSSDGLACLDSQIVDGPNTRVRMDFQLDEVPSAGTYASSGAGGENGQIEFGVMNTGHFGCYYGNTWTMYEAVDADGEKVPADTNRHVMVIGSGMQSLDGVQFGNQAFVSSCGTPMYLFCADELSYGEPHKYKYPMKARVYAFTIYEGEVVVRDFVPCWSIDAGEYGFYENITQTFYPSVWEHDFEGKIDQRGRREYGTAVYRYMSQISFSESGLTESLTNFPLAVRISPARIEGFTYQDAGKTGDYLGFKCNGNWLDYETEVWDAAGESVVWIRVPVLTNATKIKMYWGADGRDSEAPSDHRPRQMWQEGRYAAVMHLNDVGAESAYGIQPRIDKPPEFEIDRSESVIGWAASSKAVWYEYDAESAWARALTSQNFTISFWVNLRVTDYSARFYDWPRIVQWGIRGTQGGDGFWVGCSKNANDANSLWMCSHGKDRGLVVDMDTSKSPWSSECNWDYLDNWVYFTISCQTVGDCMQRMRTYVNGVLANREDVETSTATAITPDPNAPLVLFGGHDGARSVGIFMDEVRISSVVRSDAFVNAEYRSMLSTPFYSISAAKSVMRGFMLLVE